VTGLRRAIGCFVTLVIDTFAGITGFYYSKKYAAIARRLGVRQQVSEGNPAVGMIIIQIDGLSHQQLQRAMERGHLPNVSRMLGSGRYVASKWRCGLPSTTPAVQAGIMFGDNEGIPAFRWYDKANHRSMVFKLPGIASTYQSRLERNSPGVLLGGSSYVNVFDGGAYNSLFTLSTIEPHSFFEGVRGAGLVALFLLNPVRVLRVAYLAVREYATDALQRISSRLRGQSYLPVIGIFPFLRIVSNVIFREIETFAVLVDIYRGVPAIYATYYGYDEVAHHFGVQSLSAGQSLRHIDRSIGQIERLQRAHLTRPYTLYLLGDHGLTPSVPFEERFGQTLGETISEELGSSVNLGEGEDGEHAYLYQTRFLIDELQVIERNLAPPAAKVAHRISELVEARLARNNDELPEWDPSREHDVVVKSSGSLAHVYFNIVQHRMDLSEVSAAFPSLVVNLLAHPGVWLVVAREGEQVIIMDSDSILTFNSRGEKRLEGDHPLVGLPEPDHAAEQIRRIARFAESGDLILFGSYEPGTDTVTCFEHQWASHGGLGGPQDYPAIVYPKDVQWDLSQVYNASDFHALFAKQRAVGSVASQTNGEVTCRSSSPPSV
jgi:hypothetical protein